MADTRSPPGRWDVRTIYGGSTLAIEPPLGTLAPTPFGPVSVTPRGVILQRKDIAVVSMLNNGRRYDGEIISLPGALTIDSKFPSQIRVLLNIRLGEGSVIVTAAGVRRRLPNPGGVLSFTVHSGETVLRLHGVQGAKTVRLATAFVSTGRADPSAQGVHLQTAPTSLDQAPSVEVIADPPLDHVSQLGLVLQLKDPLSKKEFALAGPVFANGIVPRGALDVRDWVLHTLGDEFYHARLLEGPDAIQRLQLIGAGLYGQSSRVVTARREPELRSWRRLRMPRGTSFDQRCVCLRPLFLVRAARSLRCKAGPFLQLIFARALVRLALG